MKLMERTFVYRWADALYGVCLVPHLTWIVLLNCARYLWSGDGPLRKEAGHPQVSLANLIFVVLRVSNDSQLHVSRYPSTLAGSSSVSSSRSDLDVL